MAKRRHTRKKSRTGNLKRYLIAGSVLVALVVAYLGLKHYHIMFYDDVTPSAKYSVRGIDVSNHNGKVDFDAVASSGISFVYVKSSEGATFKDSKFKSNCRRAKAAGLHVGAYHFFRKDRDGELQARNMIAAAKGLDLDLPMVIDIEDADNANSVPDRIVRNRLADMSRVLKKAGYKVMIYTNGDGKRKYYDTTFKGEYLWLCALKDPDAVNHRGHVIQQFSHWGKCPGVKGKVDLNVFMGNGREWQKWLDEVN